MADPIRHSETSLDSHLRIKRTQAMSCLSTSVKEVLDQQSSAMSSPDRCEAEGKRTFLQTALDELSTVCQTLKDLAVEVSGSDHIAFI